MGQGHSSKQIMVVDDEPVNLRLMDELLSRRGYSVRLFRGGRLALAAARQDPPDLILLDVTMPEMDGFDFCRRLRTDTALSAIPVIFLSALDQSENKLAAFESGGFDYVTKPFEAEEMQARIETHLRLHELRIRVTEQNGKLEEVVKEQSREIASAQMATIFALAKLADSRDNETGEHLERVQILCGLLAADLGVASVYSHHITDNFVRNIFHASPLHDIGKVSIPDAILRKPGPLTPEEFTIMQGHTKRGAETLQLVLDRYPANGFIRMGIDIARSHHEKWNGDGYPDGLRGDEIPLSARIMAVADCYDALRSRRRYKRGSSHESCRDFIMRGSGHQFDPEIVRAFCNVQESFRRVSEK